MPFPPSVEFPLERTVLRFVCRECRGLEEVEDTNRMFQDGSEVTRINTSSISGRLAARPPLTELS